MSRMCLGSSLLLGFCFSRVKLRKGLRLLRRATCGGAPRNDDMSGFPTESFGNDGGIGVGISLIYIICYSIL